MTAARFKLEAVTIEGFKAFTGAQTVSFNAKNTFIFGQNGKGKSSILEAVRWCLFGLGARPGEEVRNVHYSAVGDCRVELKLKARDGYWRVERVLKPGNERSTQAIFDPLGESVRQTEVLPNISRMGPREGTHIIFSAQQLSGRRPQADISDFDKVLYSYLNISEVPELIRRMDETLATQVGRQTTLANQIAEIEGLFRDRLVKIEERLSELLRNPPWGVDEQPTHEDTHQKTKLVADEAARLVGGNISPAWGDVELLNHATTWMASSSKGKTTAIHREIVRIRGEVAELRQLQKTMEEARTCTRRVEAELKNLKDEKLRLYGATSRAMLEQEVHDHERALNRHTARLVLIREAERFVQAYSMSSCPVCDEVTQQPVAAKIQKVLAAASPQQRDLAAKLDDLRSRLLKLADLENRIGKLEDNKGAWEGALKTAEARIRALLELADDFELKDETVSSNVNKLDEMSKTLQGNFEDETASGAESNRAIEDLRTELRFHEYRDTQAQLRSRLINDIEPMKEELTSFVQMVETLRNIRDLLQLEFDAALDRSLPKLSQMMTDVFIRLTGQPAFDEVVVRRSRGEGGRTALSLRVKSSMNPEYDHNPDDVLNGQANSALRLVPYFVFSQFQSETMELDLLLIDDPSQSFDTSHVDLLLQELASAATHAQLVVASHEEERFAPGLETHFPDGCRVLEVRAFDPRRGPLVAER